MEETQAQEIRLIVKGDDMGGAHGINTGTIRAFRDGIVRATDLIVPGPWFLHAVKLLNENPGLDAGVHLTLTSEWDLYKWRPLTAPRFVDPNGYLFPRTDAFVSAAPDLREVEAELRAQIESARRLLPRISFLSQHMGTARATPELRELSERLAAEYKLPIFSSIPGIKSVRAPYKQTNTAEEKARALAAWLETLEPGTWTMIDHAAEDTPEMRSIGHARYEFVAADRSAVLAAWTSSVVKEAVRKRGIVLTTYRDVLEKINSR